MGGRYTGLLLLCSCLLIFAPFTYGISQDDLNYMARNLEVKYQVRNNLNQPGMSLTLSLKNTGNKDMLAKDWSLYFSHIRVLQPADLIRDGGTYITRDGAMLGYSGLKLFHINGVLFRIDATPAFVALGPGGGVDLNMDAQNWEVSRTDIMPNWYLVGDGTEPRVVDSTSGQSLDFVTDFTKEEQYKRSKADQYSPYTAKERYNMYPDIQDDMAVRIIPNVVSSNFETQTITVTGGDWSVVPGTSQFAANLLAEKLGLTVLKVGDTAPTSRVVELKVDATTGSSDTCKNNKATYTISIDATNEKVTITGRQEDGVLHGAQSIIALASRGSGTLRQGTVEDCPRFEYRGMHVDTARNFFPKATILKLLDMMSAYKLNKFHFHLTDDEGWRLEIPDLPELTEIGARRCHDLTGDKCIMPQLGSAPNGGGSGSGFYSVTDYKEILQYAQDRFIKVIPEFDMPGHAHAAINAMLARKRVDGDETYQLIDPEDDSRYLSVQTFIDNAMNPCINSTYVFVAKVVDEVMKMHESIQPLDIFNFGGDEVAATAWVNSTACANLDVQYKVEKRDIKKYFAEKASQLAKDRNMGLAGWEDGLMFDGLHNLPFNISDLATEDVYAYAWNNIWEWGSGSRAYRLANAGYKTVLAHATNLYFDHPHEPDPEERGYYWATRFTNTRKTFGFMPDTVYDNIEVDSNGKAITKDEICKVASSCPALEKVENIVGIQGHLWSETVRTSQQFENMVFPRFVALAERAWHKAAWESETDTTKRNAARQKDWEEWANQLGQKELQRLDESDVNYHILPAGAVLEGSILKVRAEFPGLWVSISEDNGATWCDVKKEKEVTPGKKVLFYTKSADGRRHSRTTTIEVPAKQSSSGAASGSYLLVLVTGLMAAAATNRVYSL